uniref:Uncharacterized protein n=1 Tax=Triticum urartu TaxID=4572 RepID=A0A8R7K2F8_TRIUA
HHRPQLPLALSPLAPTSRVTGDPHLRHAPPLAIFTAGPPVTPPPRPSAFSSLLSISSHISPSFSLNRDLHEGPGAASSQSRWIRPPPRQICRKWIHPGQIPTGPPAIRRLIEEYNSCPMPAKILQILSTQTPLFQEDFDEWFTKKLPQILQESQFNCVIVEWSSE